MLDGVIENESFTAFPEPRLRSNPKPAPLRNDEREVAHKAGIIHSDMRRNVGARSQKREHGVRRRRWSHYDASGFQSIARRAVVASTARADYPDPLRAVFQ